MIFIKIPHLCLESSMDRGCWRATVHGITESDTAEWLTHTQSTSPWSNSVQCWHLLNHFNYFCVQNVKWDSWYLLQWSTDSPQFSATLPLRGVVPFPSPGVQVGTGDLLDQQNAKEVSLCCHHQIPWSQGFQSSLLGHSLSGCSFSRLSCHVLRSPRHLRRPPVDSEQPKVVPAHSSHPHICYQPCDCIILDGMALSLGKFVM